MSTLPDLAAANSALAAFLPNSRSGVSYTLERMHKLMDYLGNPQDKLQIIHVAGTSGKTSTCYYVASLLKAAGKKVGLTISPHVVDINDRVQIDLQPLSEPVFCEEFAQFLDLIDKSGVMPSYFEVLIAFAYWEFVRRQVEYAVIEVGLGGLLDATNVINRADKVCIITDIGLDHVNILGNSIAEIATQKAGIIKPGNMVFAYHQSPKVAGVLQRRCQKQKADLQLLHGSTHDKRLSFLPLFQQRNFTLAEAAINYILERDTNRGTTEKQILEAARVLIPGRMEIFIKDGKTIVLDGAHNAQKLKALFGSIKAAFPDKPLALLLSFADGRSFRLESSIQEINNLASHTIITAFSGGQDLPYGPVKPEVLDDLFKSQGNTDIESIPDMKQALQALTARPEQVLLVTGSFYLVSNIRPLMVDAK